MAIVFYFLVLCHEHHAILTIGNRWRHWKQPRLWQLYKKLNFHRYSTILYLKILRCIRYCLLNLKIGYEERIICWNYKNVRTKFTFSKTDYARIIDVSLNGSWIKILTGGQDFGPLDEILHRNDYRKFLVIFCLWETIQFPWLLNWNTHITLLKMKENL